MVFGIFYINDVYEYDEQEGGVRRYAVTDYWRVPARFFRVEDKLREDLRVLIPAFITHHNGKYESLYKNSKQTKPTVVPQGMACSRLLTKNPPLEIKQTLSFDKNGMQVSDY